MRKQMRAATRAIVIAEDELVQLDAVIRRALAWNEHPAANLSALAGELRRAHVLPRSRLPRDVVTMHSTVRVRDLETGEEDTYTLVYPDEADIGNGRLSVLAPVGTALLGYQARDEVEWPVPAGVARFRIEEVWPSGGSPAATGSGGC